MPYLYKHVHYAYPIIVRCNLLKMPHATYAYFDLLPPLHKRAIPGLIISQAKMWRALLEVRMTMITRILAPLAAMTILTTNRWRL